MESPSGSPGDLSAHPGTLGGFQEEFEYTGGAAADLQRL